MTCTIITIDRKVVELFYLFYCIQYIQFLISDNDIRTCILVMLASENPCMEDIGFLLRTTTLFAGMMRTTVIENSF